MANKNETWVDGVAAFLGQDSANQLGDRRPDASGAIKPTVWDNIWNRSSQELSSAYNEKLRRKYGDQIEALGGTFVAGRSPGQYLSQISDLENNQKNERFDSSPQGRQMTHQMGLQTQQMGQQTAALQQQGELMRGQLKLQTQSMNNQNAALIAQMKILLINVRLIENSLVLIGSSLFSLHQHQCKIFKTSASLTTKRPVVSTGVIVTSQR